MSRFAVRHCRQRPVTYQDKQAGLTIVELTITIVMTGIVAAAMITFVISTLQTYGAASAKAELLGQAQTAADRISDDIMLSAVADVNNRIEDANSPDPSDPLSWAGDNDTLILATAVEDQDRNILFADPTQYITHKNNVIYYLDGGRLMRRVLANDVLGNRAVTTCPPALASGSCPADTVILESVSGFSVTYYDHLNQAVQPDESRSVEVSINLQNPAYSTASVNYKARTVFRND